MSDSRRVARVHGIGTTRAVLETMTPIHAHEIALAGNEVGPEHAINGTTLASRRMISSRGTTSLPSTFHDVMVN